MQSYYDVLLLKDKCLSVFKKLSWVDSVDLKVYLRTVPP